MTVTEQTWSGVALQLVRELDSTPTLTVEHEDEHEHKDEDEVEHEDEAC